MPKGVKRKDITIDVGGGFTIAITQNSWNVTHGNHTTYHNGPLAALQAAVSRMITAKTCDATKWKLQDVVEAVKSVEKVVPDIVVKMDEAWHQFLSK